MSNFRPKAAMENRIPNQQKESVLGESEAHKMSFLQKEILRVFEDIRELKIDGDKKRLIKIDGKNEDILKVLYPVFSVDVTRFINFLLTKFFEEHPEIVKEIKKSFKSL